jgi:Flp pilus assembly protein TadG
MNAVKRLFGNARGATAVEFAIVAPTFLMMIFLMLDGGRMLFTKQALNELAMAAARCTALKSTGCATASAAQTWVVDRARQKSQLALTTSMVTINMTTNCNGQANMAKATIDYTYQKGPMNLLPQSTVPSTLTSSSCFPIAT